MTDAIPSFYLYGEPHRAVDRAFLHVEHLADRSRPSGWTIRPHAHADLLQLLLIVRGGGVMHAEERAIPFDAPALLLVPAGVVHGFAWHDESTGFVLTLARAYLDELSARDRDLAGLFARPLVRQAGAGAAEQAAAYMTVLIRELGWSAAGHRAAVEGALLALLVLALRTAVPVRPDRPVEPGAAAALVARFRARIETRYRARETIGQHAAALGVGESSLRAACTRIAGASPQAMLDARTMLEARRALLYTNLSMAQIAWSLGFADPAYFSRFFTRHEGLAPRLYRQRLGVLPAPG